MKLSKKNQDGTRYTQLSLLAGSLEEENLANHTVQQADEKERTILDTSGRRCLESFERFNHVGLWAKTFAALLVGMEGWYSTRCRLTWKLRGTKSSRLYFQLAASTLPTEGIESGLLPTPSAQEFRTTKQELYETETGTIRARYGEKQSSRVGLEQLATSGLLPTPQSKDWKGGATSARYKKKGRSETNDLPTWLSYKEDSGKTSQLNPLFVQEMMGFPEDYLVNPFLKDIKDGETRTRDGETNH